MPYINTTTTEKIDAATLKSLKEEFAKAITLIPGKSEEWLMLNFTDEAKMFFGGSADGGAAMIEVAIFGSAKREHLDALTLALCDSVEKNLGVGRDRIYVKFSEHTSWGHGGELF